jgi:hypothetical protein
MPGAAHAGKMDCRRVKSAAGAIFRLENAASHKRTVGTEKIDDFRAFPKSPEKGPRAFAEGRNSSRRARSAFLGVKTPRGGIWFS